MTTAPIEGVPAGVDPLWFAQQEYEEENFAATITICSALLAQNPRDQVRELLPTAPPLPSLPTPAYTHLHYGITDTPQAAWLLKARAMVEDAWIDDIDGEDPTLADAMLDDHAVSAAPRYVRPHAQYAASCEMPTACVYARAHVHAACLLDVRICPGLEHPWSMLANPVVGLAARPARVLCRLQCDL